MEIQDSTQLLPQALIYCIYISFTNKYCAFPIKMYLLTIWKVNPVEYPFLYLQVIVSSRQFGLRNVSIQERQQNVRCK